MLVETAFLASTASLLWLLNYYFPVGPLFKFLFPIPIALIYLRWGKRAGWMTAVVSGLLLSVLMGPTRSILFLIPYGIMGVQLGACWRRRVGWLTSISLGALLDCLGIFFRFWLTSLLLGEDLWQYTMARIRDLSEWIFIQLGILAEPSLLVIQILAIGLILLNNCRPSRRAPPIRAAWESDPQTAGMGRDVVGSLEPHLRYFDLWRSLRSVI
jgi:uncharacterized protein YybS (DUF2232 family)